MLILQTPLMAENTLTQKNILKFAQINDLYQKLAGLFGQAHIKIFCNNFHGS